MQSQEPGPALAKDRNGVGLGSEIWTVIKLREGVGSSREGEIESVSAAASWHHLWTPIAKGPRGAGPGIGHS